MSLVLIGSLTSPYVRRLRLYLDKTSYEFEVSRFLENERDDVRLTQVSPIKRVPVLIADGTPIWESRIIFNYLQRTLNRRTLSLSEENVQSAIDALQDSLILPYLMQRFNHPVDLQNAYWQRTKARESELAAFLVDACKRQQLEDWYYPAISLWCLLDWAYFRKIMTPEETDPVLRHFYQQNAQRPLLMETDPRKA